MSKRKIDVQQQVFGFPDEDLKTSLHDEIVLWLKRNAEEICRQLIRWPGTWDPQLIESSRKRPAATVPMRMDLLRESLAKDKSRLEAINSGRSRCFIETSQDLEKRVKAMDTELSSLQSWRGLGEPPAAKLDIRCEIEQPILRRRYETADIIGYADVVLSVRAPRLSAGIAPSNGHGEPYLGVDTRRYAEWTVDWTDFRSFAFDAKTTIRSLGELIRQFKAYRTYSRLPFYAVSPDSRFANDISDEGFGFIKYPDANITFPKRVY
jgi:hypothetical protein